MPISARKGPSHHVLSSFTKEFWKSLINSAPVFRPWSEVRRHAHQGKSQAVVRTIRRSSVRRSGYVSGHTCRGRIPLKCRAATRSTPASLRSLTSMSRFWRSPVPCDFSANSTHPTLRRSSGAYRIGPACRQRLCCSDIYEAYSEVVRHRSRLLPPIGLEQHGVPVKIKELLLTAGEHTYVDNFFGLNSHSLK